MAFPSFRKVASGSPAAAHRAHARKPERRRLRLDGAREGSFTAPDALAEEALAYNSSLSRGARQRSALPRRLPAARVSIAFRSIWSGAITATRAGVHARRVAFRVPSPTIAPSPRIARVRSARLLAVDYRSQYSVKQQVELVARISLLDQPLVGLQLPPRKLRLGFEEPTRELALEGALRLGDERLGVLVAPRGVLAVGLSVPGLEVDRPRFVREVSLLVIHPVPREGAGPDELVVGGAIRADRQRQRRPRPSPS